MRTEGGEMSWLALHRAELQTIRQELEDEGMPERDALRKWVALLDTVIEELPTEIVEAIEERERDVKQGGGR